MLYRFNIWNNARQSWDDGSEIFGRTAADRYWREYSGSRGLQVLVSVDGGKTWEPQRF